MKKFFSYLLVMGAFLCMPFMVKAADYKETINVPGNAGDFTTTTLSSGDEQRTYKIMITLENNTENHKVTQKTIKFTLGKAITEYQDYVTQFPSLKTSALFILFSLSGQQNYKI